MLRRLLVVGLLLTAAAARSERFDILIRNGTVYDGTGAAPIHADVAVRDGRIVRVGQSDGDEADSIIDASGLAVAPGFIDAHTHVPGGALNAPAPFVAPQQVAQGITTMIIGPDGGEAPARVREIMAALQAKGSGANYGCFVGHNGVRAAVMGEARRPATAAELERMRALVREGMEMGCIGLSAGLMYPPGMFSPPDEIVTLAREVAPFGGIFDSHSRDPVGDFIRSETETMEISAAAGVPARLTHLKPHGLRNRGRSAEIVQRVEQARAGGQDVVADIYPYDGAVTGYLHDLVLFPEGPPARTERPLGEVQAQLRAALARAGGRDAVRDATNNGIGGGFSWLKAGGYDCVRILTAPGRPELVGRHLSELAQAAGRDPFDLLAELVLASRGDIWVTIASIDEGDMRTIISQPWTMVATDGGYIGPGTDVPGPNHPRSTGTFARVLGRYSRDVGLFPLQEAIRKMTSFPADHLRLHDRGRLAPGLVADIVIFDPRTVTDRSTYEEPGRLAEGFRHVLVNGRFVMRDGRITGETPGRFVARQGLPARAAVR